jgi:hypothetical protein
MASIPSIHDYPGDWGNDQARERTSEQNETKLGHGSGESVNIYSEGKTGETGPHKRNYLTEPDDKEGPHPTGG